MSGIRDGAEMSTPSQLLVIKNVYFIDLILDDSETRAKLIFR